MNALEKQVGGSHYKDFAIQPAEFCQRNRLPYCEANVIKYVSRHRQKNGADDIKKAIHYLEMLLEMEYSENKRSVSESYHGFWHRGERHPSPGLDDDHVVKPHNPDKLTHVQVDASSGYRLLDGDEIGPIDIGVSGIEVWNSYCRKWDKGRFNHLYIKGTYRTKKSRKKLWMDRIG